MFDRFRLPIMRIKTLILISLFYLKEAETASSSSEFDIKADWISWDDSTWTLKSTKPLPGIFTAWLPQSNGYA